MWAAIPGVKPKESQDAQIVLGDPRLGVTDKPEAVRKDVVNPAQGINDVAKSVGIQRVHREITPRRIDFNPLREGDFRAAAIGFEVLAKRRYLVCPPLGQNRHRAMRQPGRNHLEVAQERNVSDLFRRCVGGYINVTYRFIQHRVANAAAHQERTKSGALQGGAQGLGARVLQPLARYFHGFVRSAKPRRIRAVAPQM